jgi:hypothetical protein
MERSHAYRRKALHAPLPSRFGQMPRQARRSFASFLAHSHKGSSSTYQRQWVSWSGCANGKGCVPDVEDSVTLCVMDFVRGFVGCVLALAGKGPFWASTTGAEAWSASSMAHELSDRLAGIDRGKRTREDRLPRTLLGTIESWLDGSARKSSRTGVMHISLTRAARIAQANRGRPRHRRQDQRGGQSHSGWPLTALR